MVHEVQMVQQLTARQVLQHQGQHSALRVRPHIQARNQVWVAQGAQVRSLTAQHARLAKQ
jgi:hypothetical protein